MGPLLKRSWEDMVHNKIWGVLRAIGDPILVQEERVEIVQDLWCQQTSWLNKMPSFHRSMAAQTHCYLPIEPLNQTSVNQEFKAAWDHLKSWILTPPEQALTILVKVSDSSKWITTRTCSLTIWAVLTWANRSHSVPHKFKRSIKAWEISIWIPRHKITTQ